MDAAYQRFNCERVGSFIAVMRGGVEVSRPG